MSRPVPFSLLSVVCASLVVGLASCSDPSGPEESDEPTAATSPSTTPSTESSETGSAEPAESTEETDAADEADETGEAVLDQYGVAAAHPDAVAAGTEILDAGGNAVDAAIATAFAVSVVEPYASGIGGGGASLIAEHGEQPVSYDYREVVAQHGNIPDSGTGIPGMVHGMDTLHEEYGSLAWDELLAPAIQLAEDGSTVTDLLAQRLRSDFGPVSTEGMDAYHTDGGSEPLAAGDTLVQPELAETLTTLADDGAEAFYTGTIAEQLTDVDGLDADSLADYETEQVEPVSGKFGDYEMVSAAPPLPGAAVIQQLQIAEGLGAAEAEVSSAEAVDAISQAWQIADQSVTDHVGDPDFVDVPVNELTDAEANQSVANHASTTSADAQQPSPEPLKAGNTTHLTVVDEQGLTVSMTNTLTSFWGGEHSENVGGFFLNNQLSRFDAIDTENNQPEPGRKSVSWSAPSMVLDSEGRAVLSIGSPGGHKIPNILASVLVPWALQGSSLEEAVNAPRHGLQDGVLALEEEPSDELQQLIDQRGWQAQITTREQAIFGSVQALEVDYENRSITGAQDTRRDADFDVSDAGGSE